MIPFLLAKTFGIPRYLIAVMGIAVLFIALMLLERADDKANQTIGANVERTKSLEGILENVNTANEVDAEIRSNASCTLYNQCVRSSRNGAANCQQFLPTGKTSNDCPAASD